MATQSPTEAMMDQLAILHAAIIALQKEIDDTTGSVNPDEATWRDVARLAATVDRIQVSGILGDDE